MHEDDFENGTIDAVVVSSLSRRRRHRLPRLLLKGTPVVEVLLIKVDFFGANDVNKDVNKDENCEYNTTVFVVVIVFVAFFIVVVVVLLLLLLLRASSRKISFLPNDDDDDDNDKNDKNEIKKQVIYLYLMSNSSVMLLFL